MIISNSTSDYINQTYTNQAQTTNTQTKADNSATESKTARSQSDSINLSETTKDLQKISQAMDTESSDRTQKVQDLKNQVEAGQYNVNAEQVAEKMIGSVMDAIG
jgi:negative regulator of flagellin synthesis FlgM